MLTSRLKFCSAAPSLRHPGVVGWGSRAFVALSERVAALLSVQTVNPLEQIAVEFADTDPRPALLVHEMNELQTARQSASGSLPETCRGGQ